MECPNCGEQSVERFTGAIIDRCTAEGCCAVDVIGTRLSEQEMVREFHLRNGFKVDCPLESERIGKEGIDLMTDETLELIAGMLHNIQIQYQKRATTNQEAGDARLYRTLLMAEELAEIVDALVVRDEVAYADGLGDLLYVTYGCGVTNDIPLYKVFAEIQRANMAKKKRDSENDSRMRDKGENWQRPDIKGVIDKHRKEEFKYHWVCDSFDADKCKPKYAPCHVKDNGSADLKYCIAGHGECVWKEADDVDIRG